MPIRREQVREIWYQIKRERSWRQTPGQRTELEIQVVTYDHDWLGSEGYYLGENHPSTIEEGDTVGRDRDDNFVILRDREDLEQYLAENLDESPDETFIPEQP